MPAEGYAYVSIDCRTAKIWINAPSPVLKYLEQFKRPYLTEVEEKVLGLIENEYGIDDRFGFELNNGYDCNYL
jgi:hypothetical protein